MSTTFKFKKSTSSSFWAFTPLASPYFADVCCFVFRFFFCQLAVLARFGQSKDEAGQNRKLRVTNNTLTGSLS